MTIGLKELLEKADKKLQGVHPTVAAKARQLISQAYKEGIPIIITQGFRSVEEQNELYAQGRTKPGKIVTNARGGYSYHNFGLAFDFAVLNPDGSVNWNVDAKWKRVGQIGKSLGLEWGGDWTSFKDYPHFQYTFGLSLAQLRAGKRPPAVQSIQKEEPKMTTTQKSAYDREVDAAFEFLKQHGVVTQDRRNEPVTRAQMFLMLYRFAKNVLKK